MTKEVHQEPFQTDRQASGEVGDTPPNWMLVVLYKLYADLNETELFLEKWGSLEIYAAVVRFFKADQETQEPELQQAKEWKRHRKKLHKKKKTPVHTHRELAINESVLITINNDQKAAIHLLSYTPFRRFKHFFEVVAPRLSYHVNKRLSSSELKDIYAVREICLGKNKVTFKLSRVR